MRDDVLAIALAGARARNPGVDAEASVFRHMWGMRCTRRWRRAGRVVAAAEFLRRIVAMVDVAGVVHAAGESLDRAHIERWAPELGVGGRWERVRDES